uniref:Zinc finger and BTB domain containing 32 n=1 Tax=Oreochromis aureus TaxID=47969 RepID=A0AAZ1XT13_OREAU
MSFCFTFTFHLQSPSRYGYGFQADALRRSGSLCDAIISVKSQTFRAHRLVLACASRVLAQQLAHGDIDSPVRCTLEYFSPHTFQQVLDFTYTQTLEVSVNDLHLLLEAAQLLEMQPLEDQCRKQLDTLDCKAEKQEKRDKTTDVKVEKETPEGQDQHPNASPFHEDKLLKRSFPGNEASTALENLSPSTPTKTHSSPSPPRKKAKLSPISEPIHSRNSAVAKPASSNSSFSYPWTFSTNMWDSVSTLRRIAENYPSLLAAHPLQSPNQSSIPYPYSLSSPQMFPLLSSHFQTPGQNPVMGYSGFHPRYPVLRESVSTQLGKTCTGCRFCGRGDVTPHESETRGDHRGEKPYQCQHCPKKFSLKHQLDTHHRVHTGEKPFECRLCGQRSRDYSAMIKHLRTHGGAAPYQCTVCLEFCSSLVAMQRHIKSHAVQDFPPDWSINSTYLYISHI